MFKLTQSGPERGDCSAPYVITLNKSYTVREFIDEVLANRTDEWGTIGIRDNIPWSKGTPQCEYRKGRLITNMPDEVMDKKIQNITADGGWSNMDYLITLE